MRISKKFAGDKCLGKQIYVRKRVEGSESDAEAAVLAGLEAEFLAAAARAAAGAGDKKRGADDAGGGGKRPSRARRAKPETAAPPAPADASDARAPSPAPSVETASDDSARASGASSPSKPLSFKRLGSSGALSRLPQSFLSAGKEARELAEAHSRANAFTTFDDLPRAEIIQSPPAQLMLELGPVPRAPAPHPTMGAYAFSIARGTSSHSLQRLGDQHRRCELSERALDVASAGSDDDELSLASGGYEEAYGDLDPSDLDDDDGASNFFDELEEEPRRAGVTLRHGDVLVPCAAAS